MTNFQLKILHRNELFLHNGLDTAKSSGAKFLFLDRAIPDGIGYFEFNKLNVPAEIEHQSTEIKYSVIFVPDFLDAYELRSERRENAADAHKIHDILIKVYAKLGYNVVIIPAMSVE